NFGFNVLRSDSIDGDNTVVNPQFILSDCSGQVCGSTYVFTDTTVSPSQVYWYTIQSVTLSGEAENNDPAICATGGPVPCGTLTPTATVSPTPPVFHDTATPTATTGSSTGGSILFAPTATQGQSSSFVTDVPAPTFDVPTSAPADSGSVTRIGDTPVAAN